MKLKPNVHMELDGKKLANLSCTCSPELKQRVLQYQSDFGIDTISLTVETILREFFVKQDIGPIGHISHPIEAGVRELHHLTLDITLDGIITPLERQRWTKKMSELFYRMWNEEQEKREEIA